MAEEDEQDEAQKTEEPTPRRLEQAIERGQLIYSREVATFLMFAAFLFSVWIIMPNTGRKTLIQLRYYLENCDKIFINASVAEGMLVELSTNIMLYLAFPLLIFFLVGIISVFIQNGRVSFNLDNLMPKLEKISPFKGLARIFSFKSLIEVMKGVFKIILVGFTSYLVLASTSNKYKLLHDHELSSIIKFMHQSATDVLIAACIVMAFIATFDYLYQRFEFYKTLKMSKHDIKQEYKETEGSPEIKSKLKQMRQERAKKRMMAQVPKADVIITNPTHYSVALKYEEGKMSAPVVVAKGVDRIAFNIREVATKHGVPIVENPPLARDLYRLVEIDEEVPVEYYQAVAEIISYVYKLKNKIA